ncbi:MAG TPA: Re/Si-specific NAD(P)(+) transhydrogenase subunit alpha [Gemmatimonadota bacterium]|nr:Re/Si-specific NAD(P)(+) transhydrogenase subunit alpha [Gemmatimonadota bacterium]
MRIGIPMETRPGERRVAATPETVKKLVARGAEVAVERGAGEGAAATDADYEAAGAGLVSAAESWDADLVLKVQPPTAEEAGGLRQGAALVSFLYPESNADVVDALIRRGATVLAMESVPRIARAQKMDALSSMANIAGYRAILEAANAYGRFFPLLMTAAGTVTPAQVLVIGAGVAGLSAIATARRLGAVVRAFDPRPAVRDQVESLGARFVELELEAEETAGGYAAAQSEEFLRMERELLAGHLAEVDIVVSAALIRGHEAPVLLTEEMVGAMRRGSVIVDLAVEQGGNCALSRLGEAVVEGGVTILGYANLPGRLPIHASQLYARNVLNLVSEFWGDDGFAVDLDDEVGWATTVIHAGRDRREEAAGPPVSVPAGDSGEEA